ncbi:CPBP family glutamic-type intramembrane protease [Amycolatopsis sp. NBC_00348]|uniref:CPBP family glutamic-type intramembrane protease n=1 Tax=Amycolatopsis sp. NBC_00348 TaxID=2975956 RepID=UPI002E26A347
MSSQPVKAGSRALPVWAYLALVVGYVVVTGLIGWAATAGIDVAYASPTSLDEVWRSLTLPVGIGLVLVAVAITALRWWRPVLTDDRPVQRWVVAVPVIMVVAILLATDYAGLADRGLGFTLLLLLSALFVGYAEEALFRGIGVTVFRAHGFSEGKVALWSSVVFGVAHAANLFSTGPKALVQVLVVAVAGYFFYLVRRRTGGLLLPGLLHGLWDFSLISSAVVPGRAYVGPGASVLALVVLTVLVLVRRRRIEL